MNKYEKALRTLSDIDLQGYYKDDPFGDGRLTPLYACDCYREEFEAIGEIVDKATPKKPIKDYSVKEKHPSIEFKWQCPSCGNWLRLWYDDEPDVSDRYCSCCGQALDWSDDNE